MQNEVAEILKRNQLSVTGSRRKILELFHQTNSALAHADIEKQTSEQFDRVTIYRTLQTFVEKGIIHTIPTASDSIRYALCNEDCTEGHHQDNHLHFICDNCGSTYCLENVTTPEVNLPKGFKANQVDVVVSGICKNCE